MKPRLRFPNRGGIIGVSRQGFFEVLGSPFVIGVVVMLEAAASECVILDGDGAWRRGIRRLRGGGIESKKCQSCGNGKKYPQ